MCFEMKSKQNMYRTPKVSGLKSLMWPGLVKIFGCRIWVLSLTDHILLSRICVDMLLSAHFYHLWNEMHSCLIIWVIIGLNGITLVTKNHSGCCCCYLFSPLPTLWGVDRCLERTCLVWVNRDDIWTDLKVELSSRDPVRAFLNKRKCVFKNTTSENAICLSWLETTGI